MRYSSLVTLIRMLAILAPSVVSFGSFDLSCVSYAPGLYAYSSNHFPGYEVASKRLSVVHRAHMLVVPSTTRLIPGVAVSSLSAKQKTAATAGVVLLIAAAAQAGGGPESPANSRAVRRY